MCRLDGRRRFFGGDPTSMQLGAAAGKSFVSLSRHFLCVAQSIRPRLADAAVFLQPTRVIGAGVVALGIYGFVATLQPDANFGRILAAYGGVFVAGSLAWGMVVDGFRPDKFDIIGALICLAGVAVIMYSPRPV